MGLSQSHPPDLPPSAFRGSGIRAAAAPRAAHKELLPETALDLQLGERCDGQNTTNQLHLSTATGTGFSLLLEGLWLLLAAFHVYFCMLWLHPFMCVFGRKGLPTPGRAASASAATEPDRNLAKLVLRIERL